MYKILIGFLLAFSLSLGANEQKINEVSEAFGHLLGKNLETIGVNLDVESVVKGLKDSLCGREAPMSEAECIDALAQAQEKALQKRSKENLIAAENFLSENEKRDAIISLEENKLQYEITREGKGESVTLDSSPTVQYVGRLLDGSIFGSSQNPKPFSLNDTIPGFRKGLIGMKKGEKRTLYIHPDLAYGTSHVLPPNSLLTFEIEVVDIERP